MKIKTIHQTISRGWKATVLYLLSCHVSNATVSVVFLDDFNGASGSLLNGSTASATGQTWTGSNAYTESGGNLVFPSTSGGIVARANLAAGTFVPNSIYRLSTQFTMTSSTGSQWVAFGFSDSASANYLSSSSASIYLRDNLEAVTSGDNFTNHTSFSPTPPASGALWQLFDIELTTGSTLANSSAKFFIQGNQVGSALATDANNVNTIFYQTIGGGVTATSSFFQLTHEAVPETSSTLLLGASSLLALRRRR